MKFLALLLLLGFSIHMSVTTFGQSNPCEFEGNPNHHAPNNPPVPECNPDNLSEVCTRVKIHFINPTGNPSQSPSDAEILNLLRRMNDAFKPGKIRLTLDGECVNRADVSYTINTAAQFYALMFDEFDELDPPVEFAYNENAINIYMVQGLQGASRANNPAKFCVVTTEFSRIIHEVGHLFSLRHTFGNANENVANFCHDPSAVDPGTGELRCRIYGDYICDTPLDPFSFDLDNNNAPDHYMWGTCTINPDLFNYTDGCGSNDWNPPFTNFMSYYWQCMHEFSPCQLGLANESIHNDIPEVIVSNCAVSDIVVDDVTIWQNTTVELVPGQRIRITKDGVLTLDNCTVTRKLENPNENCESLLEKFWDGIYIEGKGGILDQYGNPIFYGKLIVQNNSKIKFSANGIQALNGCHGISISNSTLESNLTVLNVRDPWPFVPEGQGQPESYRNDPCGYYLSDPPPLVYLYNSDIEVYDAGGVENLIAPAQINSSGSEVTLNNVNMSNPNGTTEPTVAVIGARGKLSILNGTTIDNFRTGIIKGADVHFPCGSRGLLMRHSSVLRAVDAIVSDAQFVSAFGNYIEGDISIEGFSHSSWISNNITSSPFHFYDPKESVLLRENRLDCELNFSLDNGKSFSLCNEYDNPSIAVGVFEGAIMPPSWGLDVKPSGNKFLTGSPPSFLSEDTPIINYHALTASHQFSYLGVFVGINVNQGSHGCSYGTYPQDPPNPVTNYVLPSAPDYSVADARWRYLDSLRIDKESGLSGATPSQTKILLQEIATISHEMSDTVRVVLTHISGGDESIDSIWRPRSHSRLDEISELRWLWYTQQFDTIEILLAGSQVADALALYNASEFMRSIELSGRDLFSLCEYDLDSLYILASSIFGDYTNVVRDFLAVEYSINVRWPGDTLSEGTKPFYEQRPEMEFQTLVYPNPSTGCFYFERVDLNQIQGIRVYDYLGKVVGTTVDLNSNTFCLEHGSNGVYLAEFTDIRGMRHIVKVRVIAN